MDFTGRYEILAPPELVWAALNDPSTLQACIPGCEQLTRRDDRHFDAVAAFRVGPVKARILATIEQVELDPPHRCLLRGEGRGGAAGFGRGEAEIVLESGGTGTVLTYTARATIGGKLGQVGRRLVDGAARRISDNFFARFAAQIADRPLAPMTAIEMVQPDPVAETADAATVTRRDSTAPEIWVIGLIAVIVLLLVLFGVAL